MFNKLKTLVPVAVGVAAAGVLALATPAHAATAQCTAVPLAGCVSINSEVPGLPDLDVYGGAAVSGNSLIVFPRSTTDKAEDFAVQVVAAGSTSVYTPFPVLAVAPSGSTNVRIQYTPRGVASGLCVSTVNPVAGDNTPVQLRNCDNTSGTYNPYQTFVRQDTGNPGDGQFVVYREVINHLALTDPKSNGSVGVVGHRVHVVTSVDAHTTNQLWGQNGA